MFLADPAVQLTPIVEASDAITCTVAVVFVAVVFACPWVVGRMFAAISHDLAERRERADLKRLWLMEAEKNAHPMILLEAPRSAPTLFDQDAEAR